MISQFDGENLKNLSMGDIIVPIPDWDNADAGTSVQNATVIVPETAYLKVARSSSSQGSLTINGFTVLATNTESIYDSYSPFLVNKGDTLVFATNGWSYNFIPVKWVHTVISASAEVVQANPPAAGVEYPVMVKNMATGHYEQAKYPNGSLKCRYHATGFAISGGIITITIPNFAPSNGFKVTGQIHKDGQVMQVPGATSYVTTDGQAITITLLTTTGSANTTFDTATADQYTWLDLEYAKA
jgi:hypothetical protein